MTSVAAEKPKTVRNSSPSPQPRSPKAGSAAVASSSRLTHQSSTGSLLGSMRSSRDRDIMDLVPSAAECSYAACFCEENVWKLCDHVQTTAPNELAKAFVIFVSNKKQVNGLPERLLFVGHTWQYAIKSGQQFNFNACLDFGLQNARARRNVFE